MIDYEAAASELRTVNDLVRWGASQFNKSDIYFGHGTNNAIDEALALVLFGLNLEHGLPNELMAARVTQTEREAVIELLKRRIEEKLPAAYLTNEAWFAGLKFFVDERVLVPRSPIAELIESGFEPWIDSSQVHSVLDLCTGSGCIAIACAYAFPEAEVDAVDISEDALAVARINTDKHHLSGQMNLLKSDVFNQLTGQTYDVIVSNPPYVDAQDMNALPHEFTHEPTLGLEAGEDGLDIVIRILREARAHLNPGGILVVEVGNSQHALMEKYPEVPFMWVEFARGGDGVFVLDYSTLRQYSGVF